MSTQKLIADLTKCQQLTLIELKQVKCTTTNTGYLGTRTPDLTES